MDMDYFNNDIIKAMKDGLVVTDTQQIVIYVNSGLVTLLGYSPEEIIGRKWLDFVPSEHYDMVHAAEERRSRGLSDRYEMVLCHKNGEQRDVLIDANPRFDQETGEFSGTIGFITDITEQNKDKLALHENRLHYQLLFEQSPIGVFHFDNTGKMFNCNENFVNIIGSPRKILEKINLFDLPDKKLVNELKNAINGYNGFYEGVYQSVTSGKSIPVKISISPLLDKDGKSFGCVGIVEDVTDQKQAEEAIKKKEAMHRKMLANIGDVIVIIDQDGICQYKSPNIEKLFGFKAKDMVGLSFCENIHPYDQSLARTFFNDILQTPERIRTIECRYRCHDESYRWIEFTGNNLLDDPDIQGVLGNYKDITNRKKATNKLKQKERFQNLLISMATQMINVPLGQVDEQINKMLGEIGRFSGLDRVYIFFNDYDRGVSINTHKWCADGIRSEIDNLQNVPLEHLSEIVELHQQGMPFIIPSVSNLPENDSIRMIVEPQGIQSLLIIPLISHGEYLGYVGFDAVREEIHFTETELNLMTVFAELIVNVGIRKNTDAERMALQNQLTHGLKMESVGRLAGGVAHDFNNMLGVILGHIELALLRTKDNHQLRSDLEEIQKAANRSAEITKQLLAFARKQTISPKKLNLNDTVDSMLNMLRRIIGENINLIWSPGKKIWHINMDPAQINQILANLCINARDAIEGVGRVTIETGLKTFDKKYCNEHPGFVPGEFAMLTVSDNGCGIDKDIKNKLFEPFFTTKEMGKGTGLGLATVYGIVKQNDGFINVYSEPGQGTTFNIYFPRHFSNEDTDCTDFEEKPAVAAGGNEIILLVEDEPSILNMTRLMLEENGYQVIPAASPLEAIKIAKDNPEIIDLVMTDVVMPEMNGRELAEQIKAFYPGIRFLFMSGYPAQVVSQQGMSDDKIVFVQKPFSMEDMTKKVREALSPLTNSEC
jgi:PAS domain S-box-containing protein